MEIEKIERYNQQLLHDRNSIFFMIQIKKALQESLPLVITASDMSALDRGIFDPEIVGKVAGGALFFLRTYGINEFNLFCITKASCVILKEFGYTYYDSNEGQEQFITIINEMLKSP